jgi:hypothetical protein
MRTYDSQQNSGLLLARTGSIGGVAVHWASSPKPWIMEVADQVFVLDA